MMAVKAHRDHARENRGISHPNMYVFRETRGISHPICILSTILGALYTPISLFMNDVARESKASIPKPSMSRYMSMALDGWKVGA